MSNDCANCGNLIGNLETPYLWGENVVCAGCYQRLAASTMGLIPHYATPAAPARTRTTHVTTELTGKRFKAQMLLSAFLAIAGVAAMVLGLQSSPAIGAGSPDAITAREDCCVVASRIAGFKMKPGGQATLHGGTCASWPTRPAK